MPVKLPGPMATAMRERADGSRQASSRQLGGQGSEQDTGTPALEDAQAAFSRPALEPGAGMGVGVDLQDALDGHLGVELCGLELRVSEELMDRSDIGPVLEHLRRAGVAENLAGPALLDAGGVGPGCGRRARRRPSSWRGKGSAGSAPGSAG